jgi:TPR repeat protein
MTASTIDCLRSAPGWDDGRLAVTITQPTAFFSYSREDSEFVLHVARDLKASGANVWLDQMDIVPGQRWDEAIERALAGCPRMLVVLSPASVHSTNVMDEVSFALEEGKTVIPILYRDCAIPFRLRRVQYIDLRHDYDHGLAELLKLLAKPPSTVANPGAVNVQGTPVVPEIAVREGAARQVVPQRNPGPPEATEAGTSARPGTLPTSSDEKVFHGMKIGAGLAACAVLVAISVLYWGVKPAQPKTVRSPVVQADSKPAGSTSATALKEGTASEVSPAAHSESTGALPSTQPANSPRRDNPEPAKLIPERFKTGAVTNTRPNAPANRTAETTRPKDLTLASLSRRAESGDSKAMVELGMDYVFGRGVPRDYQKANSWLRKASDGGDPAGTNNLGVLYANGYGTAVDFHQAASLYRQAAEAGYAPAMANLGSMYEKGNGVPRDSHMALDWYRRAAQAGNPSAMYDLGAMYENGEGVPKDRQQAVDWYRKAAALGEQHALQALTRLGVSPQSVLSNSIQK